MGLTHDEFQDLQAEFRKDIEQSKREGEERHKQLIATLKSIQRSGGAQEPIGFSDVLLGTKEFQNRPPSLSRGQTVNIPIQTKDILGLGVLLPQTVGVMGGPRQTLRVRNLIPSSSITAGAVQYLRESSFTNAAAPVAEGAAKPKSDKTFASVIRPVETIAHYFKVSKQSYEDTLTLAGLLDANLLYGLELKLDQQLLKGTGTSPELQGAYPLATAATTVPAASTMVDRILLAVAELAGKGYEATGAVMSSADYVAMTMAKDTQGRYLFSSVPTLPTIVTSPALAAGEWLVADFRQSHLYVREEANITVAAENEDDFTHNKLTVLGETRVCFVVYQPLALIKNGTLTP